MDHNSQSDAPPMKHRSHRKHERAPVLTLAVFFEGGLGGAAFLLAIFLSFPLLQQIPTSGREWIEGILIGLLISLPPLIFLAATGRARWRPLRRVSWIIDRFLVPMFRGRSLATLFFVSLMAGVGEELFFRGFVQEYVAVTVGGGLGVALGLTAGAVLFGLVHPMTVGYIVYAAVMGAYLGLALIITDNLLVPITAHAFYDFIALIYYARIRHRKKRSATA